MKHPTEGDLRVWHIPQIPGKPFYVPVTSPEEAIKVLNTLADYDQFQFKNNIKPDYCNASGLVVLEDGEWVEWYNEDGDEDIWDMIRRINEEEAEGGEKR